VLRPSSQTKRGPSSDSEKRGAKSSGGKVRIGWPVAVPVSASGHTAQKCLRSKAHFALPDDREARAFDALYGARASDSWKMAAVAHGTASLPGVCGLR
jgi:hypothetical protein